MSFNGTILAWIGVGFTTLCISGLAEWQAGIAISGISIVVSATIFFISITLGLRKKSDRGQG